MNNSFRKSEVQRVIIITLFLNLVSSLVKSDIETARKVISRDHLINSYALWIDEDCINIISLQPSIDELRFITGIMKLVSTLERIGDNAVKIAKCSLSLQLETTCIVSNLPLLRQNILEILEKVLSILKETIESFTCSHHGIREERNMILDVTSIIDKRFIIFDAELMIQMLNSSDPLYSIKRISYALRYLERIWQHVINLSKIIPEMLVPLRAADEQFDR